jgi:hypothetical protein
MNFMSSFWYQKKKVKKIPLPSPPPPDEPLFVVEVPPNQLPGSSVAAAPRADAAFLGHSKSPPSTGAGDTKGSTCCSQPQLRGL